MTVHAHHIARGADGWPERLEHLEEPPQALWLLGERLPNERCVAVVGSRRATPAGLAIARDLGAELAGLGVTVISGMARGIDAAAHQGALASAADGLSTVAVLGCGIDVCYPPEHLGLRDRIAAAGCVVSEEPPAMEPRKRSFPKRNRLIAALADAVVVVEATDRSGALSTARWAVDLGREVLAVPGSIRSPQSRGTNLLIRDGARPYLGLDDLLDAVPAIAPTSPTQLSFPAPQAVRGLSGGLREILERMGSAPVHPDDLGSALGLSAHMLAARLGSLEASGAVLSLPGGLVARTF